MRDPTIPHPALVDHTPTAVIMSTADVRIVSDGPALTPDDVADRMGAIAKTYGTDGDRRVVVADGFGVRVVVEHGALVLADGVGEHRRERRFGKVAAPERLVVAGEGIISTQALAWCKAQGVAIVVLAAGDVMLASSQPGRNDPRIRRAQALAAGSPAGLAAVRHLLTAKLTGQAAVLRDVFGAGETATTIADLAEGIAVADDIDECRQLEAVAAAAYFAAWCDHPRTAVGFVAKDRRRVPPHWSVFDSRRSAITGAANTNRLAERPLNALLSYCYRLAEVEARFACVRLGLDPGLGCLHLDAPGRDSLALDLIEPVRPLVDRFVLDLVGERMFHKRDFIERSDGHVRIAAPLTHELATTMPTWRKALAPHAEKVAHIFADEVVGKLSTTTPLTNAKATAAQAAVKRRKAQEARARAEAAHAEHRAAKPTRRPAAVDPERAATLFATCVTCGGPLARSRHVRCPSCWERQPGQSRDARRRRGRSIAMARSELDRWRAEHPHAKANPADFAPVLDALASVKLSAIMAACAVSKATASGWRSGRRLPALRHWQGLAELGGVAVVDPETGELIGALA
jgi:CRISPR-associated endonuclease Cas1